MIKHDKKKKKSNLEGHKPIYEKQLKFIIPVNNQAKEKMYHKNLPLKEPRCLPHQVKKVV